ncbi:hypothetical protein EDB19DRAFT_1673891, partial [Suillus lakei]
MGYLLYGVISTLIWMMPLISSILAHRSAAYSCREESLSPRVALALSHCLRWMGKLLAIVHFFSCIFQYSNFYNRCFCNSSAFSRPGAAYAMIIDTTAQAVQPMAARIGALVLACTSASI